MRAVLDRRCNQVQHILSVFKAIFREVTARQTSLQHRAQADVREIVQPIFGSPVTIQANPLLKWVFKRSVITRDTWREPEREVHFEGVCPSDAHPEFEGCIMCRCSRFDELCGQVSVAVF
jgi:hypothetical protein